MARNVILRMGADTAMLNRAMTGIIGKTTAFESQLKGADKALVDFGKKTQMVGQKMTTRLTLPIAAVGIASAMTALQFEESMLQIQTLAGESAEQVEAWKRPVRDLAIEYAISADEIAESLYFVVSSGVDAANALEVVEETAKAAAIGMGSATDIAKVITSVLGAYGDEAITAAEATNILHQAIADGKAEADEFSNSIGRVLPVASNLGIEFKEVAAAMASMTIVGLDADESATALRQVLNSLQKPTNQTKKALEGVGISADQVRNVISEDGLLAGMQLLKDSFGDNTEELGKMFPNIRALNGFLAMMGPNAENTNEIFANMEGELTGVDDAFKAVEESSGFKLRQAMIKLQDILITIGDIVLPAFVEAVEAVGDALSAVIPDLSDTQTKWVIAFAAIIAIMGPFLMILGSVMRGWVAFKGIMAVVAGGLGAPVLLILLLIGVLVILYTKFDSVKEIIDETARIIFDALVAAFLWLFENLPVWIENAKKAWQDFQLGITTAWDIIKLAAYNTWAKITNAVDIAWNAIIGIITTGVEFLARMGQSILDTVGPIANWFVVYLWPVVFNAVSLIIEIIWFLGVALGKLATIVVQIVWPVIVGLAGIIVKVLVGAWDILFAAVRFVWDILVVLAEVLTKLVVLIKDHVWPIIVILASIIWDILVLAFNMVVGVIEGFLRTLEGIIQFIRGVFTNDWEMVWDGIVNIFGGLWDIIKNLATDAFDFILNAIQELPGQLMDMAWHLLQAGWELGGAVIEGILQGLGAAVGFGADLFNALKEAVTGALKAAWNGIVGMLNSAANGIQFTIWGTNFKVPPTDIFNGLKLAAGDIITSPTVAMLGEQGDEMVVPLTRPDRAQHLMNKAGLDSGDTVTINQTINALDPYEAARAADVDLVWAMRYTA